MSNRRNMGGNRGYNNRGSNQPFQSNVNPWGGQGGGMNQGGGFLSQLTSNPQQLALALTTLLQPQNPQPLMMGSTSMNRGNFNDRFGRRDQRRHEPYNKNRGRDNRNRNQGGNKNRNQSDKKKDEKKEDGNQSVEEEEKKRDWKDEKKPAEDEEEGDDNDEKSEKKEGKFFGIPACYLTCFVCNKQMWDGISMEKHLRGRAHTEMIKALEESIGISVGILRENMRLVEERNVIEAFRLQRTKRMNKFRGPEERCNMCDLSFRGKMSVHRRSEGHQRLKRYLHPKCQMCDTEFHSRIEWIEHRLTPEHLRIHCQKMEEFAETGTRGSDGAKVITDIDEQDSEEVDLDKLLIEPLQIDSEYAITELDDSLENMQNRYPAYKSDRPLATKALIEFTGFKCELCNRSFTNADDGQAHLKTASHYYKFIEAIKVKWDEKEKREKEEREEAERKEKEDKEKAQENGEGDAEDQELDDSAMETAAEDTLNSTQESDAGEQDSAIDDSQVSQEVEEEEEEEPVEEVKPKPAPVAVKRPAPAGKPGPASKKAAVASKPGPASSKVASNASATRGRKARK